MWVLWRQPAALVGYFVATEATAAGLTIMLALRTHHSVADWWRLALLCGLAVVQAEAGRTVERARRLHVNMTSVWVFAGVLLLPADLTGVLVVLAYLHLWGRVQRGLRTRPAYRVVFSAAMIVLSAYAAAGTIAVGRFLGQRYGWPDSAVTAIPTIVAVLAFLAVNAMLVGVAARLHAPPAGRVISATEYAVELATLCLGALTALALKQSAYLAALIVPLVLVLHRVILVKQLEELATTDHKTGLLNATAWQKQAHRELTRAEREGTALAVLMIDLDHFKRINDTYGHLAGDEVLRAVARLLEAEIREYDSAGRFGGEEFAVLVGGATAPDAMATAERLRRRICELEVLAPSDAGLRTITGVSASIGVAVYPASGTTLEQLLLTADSAVYSAKSNGRNQVVTLSP